MNKDKITDEKNNAGENTADEPKQLDDILLEATSGGNVQLLEGSANNDDVDWALHRG
ncbi:MAG: hypothetical protein Q4B54_08415 [Coriobacteriales bacterium]|nr:hypothetical protein [Coriobacteriales bacterium]